MKEKEKSEEKKLFFLDKKWIDWEPKKLHFKGKAKDYEKVMGSGMFINLSCPHCKKKLLVDIKLQCD